MLVACIPCSRMGDTSTHPAVWRIRLDVKKREQCGSPQLAVSPHCGGVASSNAYYTFITNLEVENGSLSQTTGLTLTSSRDLLLLWHNSFNDEACNHGSPEPQKRTQTLLIVVSWVLFTVVFRAWRAKDAELVGLVNCGCLRLGQFIGLAHSMDCSTISNET